MPGDEWQRFANLRAYYASMYAHPGKKLLFMGSEIGQYDEWSHDRSLDWHLLAYRPHSGVQNLIRDLNALYRKTPALYEVDFDSAGFEWIDWDDRDNSVFSWIRRDRSGGFVVCVINMTPVVRDDYRLGVPQSGEYEVLINTDDEHYGGTGFGGAAYHASEDGSHGRPHALRLSLPPLSTLLLRPAS